MTAGPVFPAFVKIEHQRDSSAKSSFIAEVDSMLGDAERRFKSFSDEASRQLNSALSVQRNSVGSLDLGVDELKASAAAQQARAIAAREVANATELAARAEGDYSQNARMAVAATQALAREEEEAAAKALSHARAAEQIQEQLNKQASATTAVVAATRLGTTAQQNVINSTRASRQAYGQLGQQMQDMVVQAQMGTSAIVIFTQQMPQAAFALSGLADSTNKAEARIGTFASFLSGPWGAAIFAATAILGPFILKMFESGDAADDAAKAKKTLAERLDILSSSYETVIEATREYNKEQERSRELTLDVAAAMAKKAAANIQVAISARKLLQAELEQAMQSGAAVNRYNPDTGQVEVVKGNYKTELYRKALDINAKQLADLTSAAENSVFNIADEMAKIQTDPRYAIEVRFKNLKNEAKASIKDVTALTKRLADLNRQEAAAQEALQKSRRKSGGPSDSAIASLGDMQALLGQLLPGVRITSTAGGKHTAGSDHYKGRAIDFVPAGGMGQYTKEQMRQILMDAGVDIRRNANGVEQFFGPGDKGHSDHFHLAWEGKAPDPERVAAQAAKAQQALKEMGDRASESITRISERFDEQPKLIDQVAQATRQLDDIIADLADKRPPGFETMIAQAQEAKKVVADAINRPFREYMDDQQRSIDLQYLSLAGREDEAAALQVIYRLQDQVGIVTAEQRDKILANVEAQRQMNELLAKQQEIISAYSESISSVRSDLEGLLGGSLGGKSFLKNMQENFKQLQGRLLTEQLFGPMLRALEDQIRQSTGIKSSLDVMKEGMEDGGKSASVMATALEQAAGRVDRLFTGAGGSGLGAAVGAAPDAAWTSFLRDFDAIIGPANDNDGGGEIVVNAQKTAAATQKMALGVTSLRPEEYAVLLGNAITNPLAEIFKSIGVDISATLSGVLAGNMVGGLPGAIVGAMRGFVQDYGQALFGDGPARELFKTLDETMQGIQTGSQVAGMMKMLGVKTSSTGSQLGGGVAALANSLGAGLGPLGVIAGSILGGLIGGLFKTARTARANITGVGSVDLGGKDSKNYGAASDLADSVIAGLKGIADELGASIGSFNTTIGVRDKDYRVNTSGTSLKTKNGAINFGDDSEAAIKYAIADAIKDGALLGLRQSTLALLQAGDDIEAQLQKAVDFENVFKDLRKYTDPVGAAIQEINDQFRDLIAIFTEAGATAEEWAQLEQLYGLKRAEAVKAANEAIISSLKDLYDFLSYGDSGLSLRDREAELLPQYTALKKRVEAGDTTAYDEYAKIARELLDVERELHGSTQAYFDLLAEEKKTSGDAIARQNALAAAASNSDNPFSSSSVPTYDNTNVVSAIDNLSTAVASNLGSQLNAVNDNLGTMIAQNAALYQQLLAAANGQSVTYW